MQQRLPLLICVLLLCVIVAFSWTSYYGVKKAAITMGSERLHALTDQLSSLFGQSAKSLESSTTIASKQEPIKKFLLAGSKEPDTAVTNALQKLEPDSSWVLVQLLNADHAVVYKTGKSIINSSTDFITETGVKPDSCKIGKMYAVGDSMYYPIVASIMDQEKVIGYLARWKLQLATSKSVEQLSQLLGTKAQLYIANSDGSLWTDLLKPVPAPPIDLNHLSNFSEFSNKQYSSVIATARPVANTKWIVMVTLSRQTVLEGATRFLNWIILIGAILVAIGIFVAWRMSRNMTRPLNELMVAAASIASGDYSVSVPGNRRDEFGKLARAFNSMAVQVKNAKENLEDKVRQRTAQLEKANKELESFSYSVSHDLRAPLRAVSGYSMILKEDYASHFDAEGNRLTDKIISNAKMMGQLIDDLISFSQTGRKEMMLRKVDMKKFAQTCVDELLHNETNNKYQVQISSLPPCQGDENLIKQVWMNLIGNAIKYSAREKAPFIDIGCKEGPSMHLYYVRDNGVGFDMQYSDKLFGVFQRLHHQKEFEGTGIGLALAKRIINQHNGDIYAEAAPGEGATFYFSLPKTS